MSSEHGIATGSAAGKVILFGEHAVVYGRPAIAAALSLRVTVQLLPADGPTRFVGEDDPRLARALERAAQLTGASPNGFCVQVRSELPRAMGLGSSAALNVALLRALAVSADRPLSARALGAAAFDLETIFHGTPSGIDNSIAALGGLIVFNRRDGEAPVIRRLSSAHPIPLVIALGQQPRHTRQTVAALRARRAANPASHDRLFDEIAAIVATAAQVIGGDDPSRLGDLMNANHERLRALGVSTAELDAMVDLARRHGAAGAKLTGGGGGGAVVCYCPATQSDVVRAFERAGWRAFATEVGSRAHPEDGRSDARSTEPAHT
jgi:hydroxymethylglutaryl-CoA reductase